MNKSICTFTSINPIIININWLWQKVYSCLVIFKTNSTRYFGCVSSFIPETMENLTFTNIVSYISTNTDKHGKENKRIGHNDKKTQGHNYIFTSHDFSWLQNGQLNWRSKGSIAFLFGGGFRLLFLRPMVLLKSQKRILY